MTLNDLEPVALGKNDMALVQFIKQFLKYRLKTHNFEIFPIYSPKIEIKHTISCFLPLNSIAQCGKTIRRFSIPQVPSKLDLLSLPF